MELVAANPRTKVVIFPTWVAAALVDPFSSFPGKPASGHYEKPVARASLMYYIKLPEEGRPVGHLSIYVSIPRT